MQPIQGVVSEILMREIESLKNNKKNRKSAFSDVHTHTYLHRCTKDKIKRLKKRNYKGKSGNW